MKPKTYVGVLLIRFRATVKSKDDLAALGPAIAPLLHPEITVEAWDVDQLVEIPSVPEGSLGLQLCSVGNPDYGQYAPPSNPEFKIVTDLSTARNACASYIEEWDLGGGNWGKESGVVRDSSGTIVARFSYNLRCWSPDGVRELWVR
ncbi:MAG: hypothetical protein RIQ79_809 [Verrucomicrobiota bacterium]